MTNGGGGEANKMCPSGSDFATSSAPILPPAPVWFSIMTVWPHLRDSRSAMMRGMMSAVPPAGKGTTIFTTRAG